MSSGSQQRVLITGASSGIGRALALHYAQRGARVACLARRGDLLEALAGEHNATLTGELIPYQIDVQDREQLIAVVKQAEARFGGLDVVIANAGRGHSLDHRSDAPDLDGLEQTLRINYLAAITTLTTALPGMLQRGSGALAGVSSVGAARGLASSSGYTASKSALANHLEAMRVELRGSGVSVSIISPGFVATPMVENLEGKLPFVVSPERAAMLIARAIAAGKRDYAFPWQMRLLRRVMRAMPGFLFDRLSARAIGQKRL